MKHRPALALVVVLAACNGGPSTGSDLPDTGADQSIRGRGSLRDVVYAEYSGVDPALTSLDVHFGPAPDAPVIVFVHGGGWRTGDKAQIEQTNLVETFRDHGYALVTINMRLVRDPRSPRTTPREQTKDVAKAVRWVFDHAERIGVDRTRVSLLGYSSGAHLVALAVADDAYLSAEGLSGEDLFAVLPFDVVAYDVPRAIAEACAHDHCASERALPAIFGEDIATQRALSPLTHVAPGGTYPPFFVVSAGEKAHEPQTLSLVQSRYLREGLAAAGSIAVHHHEASLDHTELMGELADPNTALSEAVFEFLASPSDDDCSARRAAWTDAFATATAGLGPVGGVTAAVSTSCGTWRAAAGFADTNVPLRPNHLVRTGSVGKTYTAALVLMLVERGLLSLDQRLAAWFPNFPNARNITIRQMLNHSSGIANLTENAAFMAEARADPTRAWTPAELIAVAAEMPPAFPPGTSRMYSNTNFTLLGVIIERITGETYANVLEAQILDPVALDDTVFEEGQRLTRLARGYDPRGRDLTDTIHPSLRWSAGALAATAADTAEWGRAIFGSDVLEEATRRTMIDEQLGVFVQGTTAGHGGSAPGYSTALQYDLDTDVSVAVTSTFDPGLHTRLAAILLAL